MVRAVTDVSSGRRGPEPVRVQPPASRSQRRLPETLIGLLLVAGCALGVFVYVTSVRGQTPVVTVARQVPAGAALAAADLATVGVSAGDGLVTIPAGELDELVGRVARVALSPGVPLTRDVLADRSAVPAGLSSVGLALDPGGYPTTQLRPGDQVQVIATPTVAGAATGTTAPAAEVLVDAAEVFEVAPVSDSSDRLLVTVLVPESLAAPVAGAASQDAVRLAVSGE